MLETPRGHAMPVPAYHPATRRCPLAIHLGEREGVHRYSLQAGRKTPDVPHRGQDGRRPHERPLVHIVLVHAANGGARS
jgi:hypothetical protein